MSLTLVSFKVIISNLMYREFDKGNCALSDIDAACKSEFRLVGLSRVSVGWLLTVSVNGVQNLWHCHLFAKFD